MSMLEAVVGLLVLAGLVALWCAARPAPYEALLWRYDGRVAHRGGCPYRDLESRGTCARRRGHRGRHRVEQVGPPTLAMLGAQRPGRDATAS